jgi:hypothetical protein
MPRDVIDSRRWQLTGPGGSTTAIDDSGQSPVQSDQIVLRTRLLK